MPHRISITAALVALTVVGAACSSNTAGDGGTDDTKLTAAFCDAAVALSTSFNEAPQSDDATERQDYYDSSMEPHVDDLIAEAPAEISADLATLKAGIETFIRSGDYAALEAGPVPAAEDALEEMLLAGCAGEKMNVSAVEYAFEGVAATVKAGRTWIRFSNDGGELHEMALMRKNDGVAESFDELLELPEEEAQKKATFVGGGFAMQGEWDAIPIELEAGEYAMLCFVPVGSVDPEEEVDGPPHFAEGMISLFTAA